ncbi:unnamed protein product [Pedinophyceae sp. YPF-701]|nr:unnamed protein product [Pedinophyceae sp. YPF-701]
MKTSAPAACRTCLTRLRKFQVRTLRAPARGRQRASWCRAAEGSGAPEDKDSVPDSLPFMGTGADWRQARAALVASEKQKDGSARPIAEGGMWAHAISKAERGCLLIAHPLMFTANQTYFFRAVILMFEHDEEGSAGIIINKPTRFTLGSVGGAEAFLPEMENRPLMLGGDVGRDTLHCVHTCSAIASRDVGVPGLYMGGTMQAKEAVRSGDARPEDFNFFTRYAGWAGGQLDEEVQAGVWFVAAASKEVCMMGEHETGAAMWHKVLELMGGEYAELSAAVAQDYDKDIMEGDSEGN